MKHHSRDLLGMSLAVTLIAWSQVFGLPTLVELVFSVPEKNPRFPSPRPSRDTHPETGISRGSPAGTIRQRQHCPISELVIKTGIYGRSSPLSIRY